MIGEVFYFWYENDCQTHFINIYYETYKSMLGTTVSSLSSKSYQTIDGSHIYNATVLLFLHNRKFFFRANKRACKHKFYHKFKFFSREIFNFGHMLHPGIVDQYIK